MPKKNQRKSGDVVQARAAKKQSGRTFIKPHEHLVGAKFRLINEKLYNMKVEQGAKFLKENPGVFSEYHEGFRLQTKGWTIVPSKLIVDLIKKQFCETKKQSTKKGTKEVSVADFGCGDGYIGSVLDDVVCGPVKFHVDSVDACVPEAVKSQVTVEKNGNAKSIKPFHFIQCSLSNVALENNKYDVIVISLALMGTNSVVDGALKKGGTPIAEAWRCLKEGSLLIVAEVGSRIKNRESFVKLVECVGFECVSKVDYNYFITFQFVKKSSNRREPQSWLINEGSPKPGQYKKR